MVCLLGVCGLFGLFGSAIGCGVVWVEYRYEVILLFFVSVWGLFWVCVCVVCV